MKPQPIHYPTLRAAIDVSVKPCPECKAPMEYIAGHMYGEDADGLRGVWVPAEWVCECGIVEKVEPKENDDA